MFTAIRTLYGIDASARYGYGDSQIQSAQARLGIVFPRVLAAYYAALAAHEKLNQAHNRLIPPDQLSIEDGFLILYEENQGVCYWGVKIDDLNQDSPPVYVGNSVADGKKLVWLVSHQNLEALFLDMAFYNGTMGGLHYHANMLDKKVSATVLERLAQTHTPVDFAICHDRQRYFTDAYRDIVVVCDDGDGGASAVFIGTEDPARFDELLDWFGFENWSYVSDEDEDWE